MNVLSTASIMISPKNLHICFVLFQCLLILNKISLLTSSKHLNSSEIDRPGKNLCVNESVDCSNQVKSSGSDSDPRCLMKFLRANSTECMDFAFKGDVDVTEGLGVVRITPIPWYTIGLRQPNLNITFSHIRWNTLRLRFVKVGFNETQFCREFEVSENIDPSSVISFDCPWKGSSAGEKYKFQYSITSKDNPNQSQYTQLLRIPTDTDVDPDVRVENYHMFLTMDTTEYPVIKAKLTVPPRRLSISDGIVTLQYKEQEKSSPVAIKQVKVKVTGKEEGDVIIAMAHDTDNTPGVYYFTVSCHSGISLKGCAESATPSLLIMGSSLVMKLQLLAPLIMALVAMGSLLYCVLKRKRERSLNGKPKVLFVYESGYPSHIDNIYKFKDFLNLHCSLDIKLDLTDIPKTDSVNPRRWYVNSYEVVDYVILFASPTESQEKGIHEDDVYINLQKYAIQLLPNFLLKNHKFSCAGVRLPGCSWNTLPAEVSYLVGKRFSMPDHLDRLIAFMKIPIIPSCASKFVNAFQQTKTSINTLAQERKMIDHQSFPQILQIDEEDQELEVNWPNGIFLKLDGSEVEDEAEEGNNDDDDDDDDDDGNNFCLERFKL